MFYKEIFEGGERVLRGLGKGVLGIGNSCVEGIDYFVRESVWRGLGLIRG